MWEILVSCSCTTALTAATVLAPASIFSASVSAATAIRVSFVTPTVPPPSTVTSSVPSSTHVEAFTRLTVPFQIGMKSM